MAPTAPIRLFFDPLCPYAWRGLELTQWLHWEHGLDFQLHAYSLHEGNHPQRGEWRLSEQPLDAGGEEQAQKVAESLRSFLGFYAAGQQGAQAGWRYALALTRLVHAGEQRRPLSAELVQEAAACADLALDNWQAAMKEPGELREALRRDMELAGEIGVFGTPTFVLPGGEAAYLRFAHKPQSSQEALTLWNLYVQVLGSGAGIETIKRPRPNR